MNFVHWHDATIRGWTHLAEFRSPKCVERLYGKSVGGASTRLDRSPTTRKYGLFTPLRGPCSPGSVPVGTFQTVSLRTPVNSALREPPYTLTASVGPACQAVGAHVRDP